MNDLVLISIAGVDKPGITSAITGLLGQQDADILDIGQSVIHDHLSLGILVKIPFGFDALRIEIERALSPFEIDVSYVSVSPQSYKNWVGLQGASRYL